MAYTKWFVACYCWSLKIWEIWHILFGIFNLIIADSRSEQVIGLILMPAYIYSSSPFVANKSFFPNFHLGHVFPSLLFITATSWLPYHYSKTPFPDEEGLYRVIRKLKVYDHYSRKFRFNAYFGTRNN